MQVSKIMQFFREVKAEANRVTWPDWASTRQMTVMVFILVALIGVYLLVVDMLIGWGLSSLLGM